MIIPHKFSSVWETLNKEISLQKTILRKRIKYSNNNTNNNSEYSNDYNKHQHQPQHSSRYGADSSHHSHTHHSAYGGQVNPLGCPPVGSSGGSQDMYDNGDVPLAPTGNEYGQASSSSSGYRGGGYDRGKEHHEAKCWTNSGPGGVAGYNSNQNYRCSKPTPGGQKPYRDGGCSNISLFFFLKSF